MQLALYTHFYQFPLFFLLLPIFPAHLPWVCRALQFLHPPSLGPPVQNSYQLQGPALLEVVSVVCYGSLQLVWLGGLFLVIVFPFASPQPDNPVRINFLHSQMLLLICVNYPIWFPSLPPYLIFPCWIRKGPWSDSLKGVYILLLHILQHLN